MRFCCAVCLGATVFRFSIIEMKHNKAQNVYLRQRPRKNGTIALFLDISGNGKRKNEYLKLYLVPERSREDKLKNKETLRMAEAIRAQRLSRFKQNSSASRTRSTMMRSSSTCYSKSSTIREARQRERGEPFKSTYSTTSTIKILRFATLNLNGCEASVTISTAMLRGGQPTGVEITNPILNWRKAVRR